ncbi:MAG: hypothetical protein Q4P17_06495 [Methanobacterium sp.]|nr:hypothetical protein [Methanobacterium sp.]
MEDIKNIDEWCVVCRNTKCKHRYPIPAETPLEWKIRKFRGVCGHGEDKVYPELLEPVKCPECGEKSFRVIPRYYKSKICSI